MAKKPKEYDVGYCKPPLHTRWEKDAPSPNPNGRRGNRAPKIASAGGRRSELAMTVLEEAGRLVRVTEGGKDKHLPIFTSVCRVAGVAAMKGNRSSQRDFIDLVKWAAELLDNDDALHAQRLTEYKAHAERVLLNAEENGIEIDPPTPDPADIVANEWTNRYGIDGPRDARELVLQDYYLEVRDRAQAEVNRLSALHAAAECDEERSRILEQWRFQQLAYDMVNYGVGRRHRRPLDNRHLAPGEDGEEDDC